MTEITGKETFHRGPRNFGTGFEMMDHIEALEAELEVEREARREQAMDISSLRKDLLHAEAERDWWQERAEALEAENARLRAGSAMPAFVMAAHRVGKTAALEAMRREAKVEGEMEASAALNQKLERAIQTALEMAATRSAELLVLNPPDAIGRSYNVGVGVAYDAIRAIRVEDVLAKMEGEP